MKHSLLLLAFLPFSAFAQYGQNTLRQAQQSRQDFNRMTNQQTQDFMMKHQHYGSGSRQLSPEELIKAQATQEKLEKEANERLAQLAQEQQRQRQLHPASDPQQAALQQKADETQLTQLAIKNYREVFLPGQVANALRAEQLMPRAQQQLSNLNINLGDRRWWKNQSGTPLATTIKAYSDTLSALTGGLLGIDMATPPSKPAPFSVEAFKAQLATGVFDQPVATRLFRETELTAKLSAGAKLIKAVTEFNRLSNAAVSQQGQYDPKKLRDEIQNSLHLVNEALDRYYVRIRYSTRIYDVRNALMKATKPYVAGKDR